MNIKIYLFSMESRQHIYEVLPWGLKKIIYIKEYAEYLKRVLTQKGYKYTGAEEDADLVVYLSYVGDPEVYQYAYSEPTWGYTG